jgi:hypothetical protein
MTFDINRRRFLLAGVAAATVPLAAIANNEHRPSGKWRIKCNGGARSDGTVLFRLTPVGGEPTMVRVGVRYNRGENAIAHDVRDAFRAALPPKAFHIEVDDGEDVLVKKRGRQPDFLLELVETNIQHVSFNVKHD